MIVRQGGSRIYDMGPSPAHTDGIEALADRSDPFDAPVTTRAITDDERSRLTDDEPLGVMPVASREKFDRSDAHRRAAAKRGAAATANKYRPGPSNAARYHALTAAAASEVCARYATDAVPMRLLATEYGVCFNTIRRTILRGARAERAA